MGFGIDIVADSLCASLIKFCCVLNERSFKIEAFRFYNAKHIRLVPKNVAHILMSEFISVNQTYTHSHWSKVQRERKKGNENSIGNKHTHIHTREVI